MSDVPTGSPPLDELVARARQGDRVAMEAVLASVAPSIHRFGLRMCKNVHDAEDVMQDTLLNVANHLDEFEGRSSLSSWVFALTRSACTRKRRGLKNQPHADDSHLEYQESPARSPERQAEHQELALALSNALDGLSDDYREAIVLRDVEGLTAPEAAEAIGISVDALKSRLHRARESLRNMMKPLFEPSQLEAPGGCPDVVALWSKKLEGDLSQSDCAAMEKHIETCPTCSGACDALKSALLVCQRVRSEAVPPEVQARVKEAVQMWTQREPILNRPGSHR